MMMQPFEIVENVEFPDANTEFYLVLNEGKYKGTSFVFGPIEFTGEDEEGNGNISFDYTVLALPEGYSIQDDEVKREVEQEISVVLHKIIEDSLETEQTRNDNSE
jgi:hypothetical protein